MSSLPSPTALLAASPRRFMHLLHHSHYRFTERELMRHLGMIYRNIKQREAHFSTRTIGELLLVEDLLNEPV